MFTTYLILIYHICIPRAAFHNRMCAKTKSETSNQRREWCYSDNIAPLWKTTNTTGKNDSGSHIRENEINKGAECQMSLWLRKFETGLSIMEKNKPKIRQEAEVKPPTSDLGLET